MSKYILPELPYPPGALEPYLSRETIACHYGLHHAGYINKLNALIEDSEFFGMALDDVVRYAEGDLFQQAAQSWNHAFYWQCLAPNGGGSPGEAIGRAIQDQFTGFPNFCRHFFTVADRLFGSGWIWLVYTNAGQLDVVTTSNAQTPLREGLTPLLTCDLWEHAYYIDYRNNRQDYLRNFWNVVNWEFVNRQYLQACGLQPKLRMVSR